MALKDVIIGYAKGDKGDKGDTGERGATGQTGPQGEPGNIADAAITDTQGLDVAKGAKTTAQKLFDAIADRIVNKLVTNDTLTTKLADYLLKSAMSSTNIDSTTNVPTSALVYSLMQDVNNNLSNPDRINLNVLTEITSLNSPERTGVYYVTGNNIGALPSGFSNYGILLCMRSPYSLHPTNSNCVYVQEYTDVYGKHASRSFNNGAWTNWTTTATKDDLTPVNFEFTGGNGSTIALNKSYRIGKLVVVSLKIKIDTVTKDVATYSGSAKNAGATFTIGKGGEWSISSSTYAFIGNGVLTVRTEGLAVGDYLHIHGIIILD